MQNSVMNYMGKSLKNNKTESLLYTWNYHNIVNQLYCDQKKKRKKNKETLLFTVLPCLCVESLWVGAPLLKPGWLELEQPLTPGVSRGGAPGSSPEP